MVLDSLSNIISGFQFQLSGFNLNNFFRSAGRSSISENKFQNAQLRKFDKTYAGEFQQGRINDFLTLVSQRSHFERAQQIVNLQRQAEINELDNQIKIFNDFVIPKTPSFRRFQSALSRTGYKRFRAGDRGDQTSLQGRIIADIYQARKQRESYNIYAGEVKIEIADNVSNLLIQRGLITSRTFDL